jgi:hypothetical protein
MANGLVEEWGQLGATEVVDINFAQTRNILGNCGADGQEEKLNKCCGYVFLWWLYRCLPHPITSRQWPSSILAIANHPTPTGTW